MTPLNYNLPQIKVLAALCVAATLLLTPFSSFFAARPATELDEAMARSASTDQAPSGPSIQFAVPQGSTVTSTNLGVVPVPEMSSFFPILGLIAAVSCMEILRRRRAAQQSLFRR